MPKFTERIMHAWNTFVNDEESNKKPAWTYGSTYGVRPDRLRLNNGSDKSIVTSVYTRLGIDVASVSMRHVKLDGNKRYLQDMSSGLNYCLTEEANIDQAATAFRQDAAMTLFYKGVIAIVAVDTDLNPEVTGGYDIKSLRVGEITQWFPKHVKVSLYNENKGRRQEVLLPKKDVAIIENPLYSVMNEPNSTLQRLIRKLGLLDSIDEQVGSGKLDLIIQLPYVIKSEARRQQADQRRTDIEMQLKGSKYGIAYTDGTERITQLNRPAENNMLSQIEYLTGMLYGQLGLTEEIFKGTADEKTMLNYHNRTLGPVLTAITEGMSRAFLTKTARKQGQAIAIFRDPFKLVAVTDIAEIADKFTRNEIMTSNEIRAIVGLKPVDDPKADKLTNSNLNQPTQDPPIPAEQSTPKSPLGSTQTQSINDPIPDTPTA